MNPVIKEVIAACDDFLCKQDIPLVERVIIQLTEPINNLYIDNLEDAVFTIDDILEESEDVHFQDDTQIEDLVLAILGAFVEVSNTGRQRNLGALIRDRASNLLGTVPAGERSSLAALAERDLLFWQRVRFEEHRGDLKRLLREFLRSPAPRSPASRAITVELIKQLFTDNYQNNTSLGIDLWAYRQYNIGLFSNLRQRTVRVFVAVATLDEKTSAFCRYINGRVVSAQVVQQQIDDYNQAISDGDEQRAKDLWPLVPPKIVSSGTAEEIEQYLLDSGSLGLPPYHFRCRTIIAERTR